MQLDSVAFRQTRLGSLLARGHLSVAGRRARSGLLFAAPAALYFLVFWIYPLLRAVYISLTDWYLFSEPNFVGLENYSRLAADPYVWQSVKATAYYALGTTCATLLISLVLALLVNGTAHGRGFFTTALYVPAVISWVTAATVWMQIYMPNAGLYRVFLGPVMRLFGVQQIRWLDGRAWAMSAVIVVSVWKSLGANALLFLAGLQSIPEEILEAARVDGASRIQTVFRITLPLLKPTVLFVVVMLVISAFKAFTPIFVMTRGGPAGLTRVLPMYVYEEAFVAFKMGRASAVSVAMFLALLGLTVAQVRFIGSGGVYE